MVVGSLILNSFVRWARLISLHMDWGTQSKKLQRQSKSLRLVATIFLFEPKIGSLNGMPKVSRGASKYLCKEEESTYKLVRIASL